MKDGHAMSNDVPRQGSVHAKIHLTSTDNNGKTVRKY